MLGSLSGPATESDIKAFLDNCKPSRNEIEKAKETGGWFWVHSGSEDSKSSSDTGDAWQKFTQDGEALTQALTTECERIKAEEPVRENKKLGKQSQKQWREKTYAHFNAGVAKIARANSVITGKWLYYATPETVDSVWAKVVRAIASADGPLAKHGSCNTAKVAADIQMGRDTYVICIYCDDSWDKKAVGEVLEILVKDLLIRPNSYKCDANTHLGIDANHPSKIPASLWKVSDFMSKEEVDDAFAADDAAKKAKIEKHLKAAPKKKVEDEIDDFEQASDSEDEQPKKKAKKQ